MLPDGIIAAVPLSRLLVRGKRPRKSTPPLPPVLDTQLLGIEAWGKGRGMKLDLARSYARQRRIAGLTEATSGGVMVGLLAPSNAPILSTAERAPQKVLPVLPLKTYAQQQGLTSGAVGWLEEHGHLRVLRTGARGYVAEDHAEIEERLKERALWLGDPQTLFAWVRKLSNQGLSAAEVHRAIGRDRLSLQTVHEYRSRMRATGDLPRAS